MRALRRTCTASQYADGSVRFGTQLLFPLFMIGYEIHLPGSTIVFIFDYCRSRQENGITFLINAPSSAIQQANECSAKCQSIANLKQNKKNKPAFICNQATLLRLVIVFTCCWVSLPGLSQAKGTLLAAFISAARAKFHIVLDVMKLH